MASASEVEDQTVRRIKNPLTDRAARVDYYQMMRRWEVTLYRYGVRLTYDLVIPEPGSDLLRKLMEIHSIRKELDTPFVFELEPDAIKLDDPQSPNHYTKLAQKCGATITELPPNLTAEIIQTSDRRDYGGAEHQHDTFVAKVPDGYEVNSERGADIIIEAAPKRPWDTLEVPVSLPNGQTVSVEVSGFRTGGDWTVTIHEHSGRLGYVFWWNRDHHPTYIFEADGFVLDPPKEVPQVTAAKFAKWWWGRLWDGSQHQEYSPYHGWDGRSGELPISLRI